MAPCEWIQYLASAIHKKNPQYCFIIALANPSNGHLRKSLQREWTLDFGLKICIIYCAKIYISVCILSYWIILLFVIASKSLYICRCTATLQILLWQLLYIVMHKIYNNIHGPCLPWGFWQSLRNHDLFPMHEAVFELLLSLDFTALHCYTVLFILNSQLKGLNFEVCRPLYVISWMFNWSLSSFGNVGFHVDSFIIAKRRF